MQYNITVNNITYRNNDNLYTILKGKDASGRIICFTGNLPAIYEGAECEITGTESIHPTYGLQVKIIKATIKQPESYAGLVKYLSSGLVKGLGEKTAEKIVKVYERGTVEAILKDVDEVARKTKVKKGLLLELAEVLGKDSKRTLVVNELLPLGISPLLASKIYAVYGDRTMATVKQDPYRMYQDVGGVGFKTCDRIALSSGVPKDSPSRLLSCAHYISQNRSTSGNSYINLDELNNLVATTCELETPVDISTLDYKDMLVIEGTKVYLPYIYKAECAVADWFKDRLQDVSNASLYMADIVAEKVMNKFNFKLTDKQREAILQGLTNKVSVITGAPGSGKTTIIKAIVDTLKELHSKYLLTAPTGKAAQRLGQAGGDKATTIHRMLGCDESGRTTFNSRNQLDAAFLIVDESSMIDIALAYKLIDATPDDCRVIFVGDADQLPPVGAGSFFLDVINAGVPTIRLDKTHRQSEGSYISELASQVKSGVYLPIIKRHDVATQSITRADEIVTYIKKHNLANDDLIILTMGNKGELGANNLNRVYQEAFNDKVDIGLGGYRVDDKVMHRVNNYNIIPGGVYNGDTGKVVYHSDSHVDVELWNGQKVKYGKMTIAEMSLAFALTVHKSQGSEYKNVILVLSREHYTILNRRLLYTAITRTRENLHILGDLSLISIGAKKDDAQVLSGLRERILLAND